MTAVFEKPILISLSPNVEKDDLLTCLKAIFMPRMSKSGKFSLKLEQEFKNYSGIEYSFSFNSGRSALLAIVNSLGLKKGDEALIQAFTCNALANPLIKAGLKPVYVDCLPKTLNIDPIDLQRKISPRSRLVIVQHTFGLPADIGAVLRICRQNKLFLIEDCAHSLGALYRDKPVGSFGDAAFFSFGRDKIVSSVYGGLALTNNSQLAEKIKREKEKMADPAFFWVFRQLIHPIITVLAVKPLYRLFGLGRWPLLFLQKSGILIKAVSDQEKKGQLSLSFPKKMPDGLALLALNQLNKADQFISHQKEIADYYQKNLRLFSLPENQKGRVWLRYSLFVKNSSWFLKQARKKNIFLDDGWNQKAVMPKDTDQASVGYLENSCPVAEKAAKTILNLPTHINISLKDAKRIVDFLNSSPKEYRH